VIDLHCHILPAVDDGSRGIDESLEMARVLLDVGFTTVAASPHYGDGPGGDVSPALASSTREQLMAALKDAGIGLELLPNAEHYLTPLTMERIARREVVSIGGKSSWLLLELPWEPIVRLEELIFRVQSAGYKILLAHPERYRYLDEEIIERLIERQVKVQLELGSVIGRYGRRSKQLAKRWLRRGMVHVVASDLHRPEPWPKKALKTLAKLVDDDTFSRLTCLNQQAIIDDAPPSDVAAAAS